MAVTGLTEEEYERLYNLFHAMKESFSGEDEEIPEDGYFNGKYDPDEVKRREDIVLQRDRARLRKLLKKVIDERGW